MPLTCDLEIEIFRPMTVLVRPGRRTTFCYNLVFRRRTASPPARKPPSKTDLRGSTSETLLGVWHRQAISHIGDQEAKHSGAVIKEARVPSTISLQCYIEAHAPEMEGRLLLHCTSQHQSSRIYALSPAYPAFSIFWFSWSKGANGSAGQPTFSWFQRLWPPHGASAHHDGGKRLVSLPEIAATRIIL